MKKLITLSLLSLFAAFTFAEEVICTMSQSAASDFFDRPSIEIRDDTSLAMLRIQIGPDSRAAWRNTSSQNPTWDWLSLNRAPYLTGYLLYGPIENENAHVTIAVNESMSEAVFSYVSAGEDVSSSIAVTFCAPL